jgi:DNA-directed RNA polymerase specialized sigma24 family protein
LRGARDALDDLVERSYAVVLGGLYRLVGGNRSLAEDLAQEMFLSLLRQEMFDP